MLVMRAFHGSTATRVVPCNEERARQPPSVPRVSDQQLRRQQRRRPRQVVGGWPPHCVVFERRATVEQAAGCARRRRRRRRRGGRRCHRPQRRCCSCCMVELAIPKTAPASQPVARRVWDCRCFINSIVEMVVLLLGMMRKVASLQCRCFRDFVLTCCLTKTQATHR